MRTTLLTEPACPVRLNFCQDVFVSYALCACDVPHLLKRLCRTLSHWIDILIRPSWLLGYAEAHRCLQVVV
jgi:hypothetical protein